MRLDIFIKLANQTRLKPRARNMALDVLVRGHSVARVTARYGVTRQAVYGACNVIKRRLIPPDHVLIEAIVPQSEIKRLSKEFTVIGP